MKANKGLKQANYLWALNEPESLNKITKAKNRFGSTNENRPNNKSQQRAKIWATLRCSCSSSFFPFFFFVFFFGFFFFFFFFFFIFFISTLFLTGFFFSSGFLYFLSHKDHYYIEKTSTPIE